MSEARKRAIKALRGVEIYDGDTLSDEGAEIMLNAIERTGVRLVEDTETQRVSREVAVNLRIMTEKQPFIVHCGACRHEWPAAYCPMEVERFARVCAASSRYCPMCGEDGSVLIGPAPADRINCPCCAGSGLHADDDQSDCQNCDGSGKVKVGE